MLFYQIICSRLKDKNKKIDDNPHPPRQSESFPTENQRSTALISSSTMDMEVFRVNTQWGHWLVWEAGESWN